MAVPFTDKNNVSWMAMEFVYAEKPATITLPLTQSNGATPSASVEIPPIATPGPPLLLPERKPIGNLAVGQAPLPVPENVLQLAYTDKPLRVVFLATALASPPTSVSGSSGSASITPTTPVENPSNPTTTTSPPNATNSGVPNRQSDSSSGITSGAAAGIAIGCLIAGALIAGLVFWFCWRKRRESGFRDHEASRIALMPTHEKGFAANTIPVGSGSSAASPVSAALPLPLEDKAITGEVSKIANSIKNHVQSYYQNGRVSPGLVDVDDIHALGAGQPISAGTLSTLLGNTATREIALRFCIAWAVCSRMQPASDPKTSLLPQEVAGCVQSINPGKGASSAQNTSALARWRVMTAELSQASYVREPFTIADSRNASIQATLAALENILQPFADSRMDNGERKRNLEEILKRSALFAFTLFSQPSTWDFDWSERQGVKSGELCIFPALVQLSDEHGQTVNPPRPFSEAVIRRLE